MCIGMGVIASSLEVLAANKASVDIDPDKFKGQFLNVQQLTFYFMLP